MIEICVQLLYHSDLTPPPISESVFVELMNMVTRSVEFSFNDSMYSQIDGIAMGSPQGPVLASIFVGYCLCSQTKRAFADPNPAVQTPSIYSRYVDDIFAVFESTSARKVLFAYLNSLHPSLEFTLEMERSGVLPFLDDLVEKSADAYKTTVYLSLLLPDSVLGESLLQFL